MDSLGIIKKSFFLTRELSLINTCCWRADHAILIHYGASSTYSIFVSARKIISILTLYRMRMQGYCDVYKWTILKRMPLEVKCLHPTSPRREMCTSSGSNVIYHKFSHGATFYTLNGKNVNIMLEFSILLL